MDRKYIMIDSTFRDRLLYPNPAEFIMPINANIGNSPFNSTNPLADGYPIHSFCFLSMGATFSGTVVGGNPSALQVDSSIDALVGLSDPDNGTTLNEANNCIINLTLTVPSDANSYRIISYDSVRRIIYLDTPILEAFVLPFAYTIRNDSTAGSIVLQGYNVSFRGYSSNENGYFISSNQPVYIWDQTLNEVNVGVLVNYNIVLTKPFSAGWSVNDKYTMALKQEIDRGTIMSPYYLSSGIYQIDITSPGSSYTTGMEVQIVTSYDSRPVESLAVARVVFVQSDGGGVGRLEILYCGKDYTLSGEYYMLPVGETFRQGLGTVVITGTGVGFLVNSKAEHMAMAGCYMMPILFTAEYRLNPADNTKLQINPNNSLPYVPNRNMPNNNIMTGNSLNGLTPIVAVFTYQGKLILLTQPVDCELYDRFACTNLASFPEALDYQILPFLRDGCVNMDYRGTMVSSNQMVCYSLAVNTLILPNQILNLPFGALTSSYPYVFLEITNETASSGHNKSIIYSNNPNAVSVTFVCSISDVNNPITTKFINISSDRSSQIVKFKPNDNLKFRVSMPDGLTFETELCDYIPPLQANPLLQITCLVEITRL